MAGGITRLEFAQRHLLDEMALALLQDEIGALAGRQNIVMQVEQVDAAPDGSCSFDGFFVRQPQTSVGLKHEAG